MNKHVNKYIISWHLSSIMIEHINYLMFWLLYIIIESKPTDYVWHVRHKKKTNKQKQKQKDN
jgi:hypothetical protein